MRATSIISQNYLNLINFPCRLKTKEEQNRRRLETLEEALRSTSSRKELFLMDPTMPFSSKEFHSFISFEYARIPIKVDLLKPSIFNTGFTTEHKAYLIYLQTTHPKREKGTLLEKWKES